MLYNFRKKLYYSHISKIQNKNKFNTQSNLTIYCTMNLQKKCLKQ